MSPPQREDRLGELVPGALPLVGRVVEAGRALEREHADLAGEIGRVRGREDLVVDDAHLRALPRRPKHRIDEVAALRPAGAEPVEPGGADHLVAVADAQNRVLARELRLRIDVEWIRPVRLDVGRPLGAVEDVVRAHVDEPRADCGARLREPAGCDRVDEVGLPLHGLALRHVVEGRRVHHHRRPQPAEHGAHRVRVGDLEVRVREPAHVLAGERLDEVAAELSRAADDRDANQNTPPMRLSVCSISARRVIHSML